MTEDLADLYQELILDHSKSPRNFRAIPQCQRVAQGDNPICGDNYTVYVVLDGGVIRDMAFQGSGCAISKASASLMTEALKGKSIASAEALFGRVREMITQGHGDGSLEKLSALAGVHQFPARVKCAILPWHAAMAAMHGKEECVTTESEE